MEVEVWVYEVEAKARIEWMDVEFQNTLSYYVHHTSEHSRATSLFFTLRLSQSRTIFTFDEFF